MLKSMVKKQLSLCLGVVMMCGAGLFSTVALAATPGFPAPQFQFQGPKGPVSLADLKGRLVYVDFWASWCGPCRSSFPWMNSLQQKYGKQGLQVVGINLDQNQSDAGKFLSEVPASFPIVFDPKSALPKAYGVKGMPTSFLVDQSGNVIVQHQGFRDADKAELENLIRQHLGAH
jgi:cytochrome c biogenesis protein CcmG, thiol:disulfide interchange protein DsbE